MSKGNMLLGYAGGSIGDVTFARIKGQQTAHARNRHPNNPKTKKQVAQRALFADAVKFFVQGNQAFFKFAFEDKKSNESDYNAFMRNNAKRGVLISKAAYENKGYPALGNFMLSKGNLQVVPFDFENNDVVAFSGSTYSVTESDQTIGKLSQALISGGVALAGDILTFVAVEKIMGTDVPEVEPATGEYETNWTIKQITLDPESNVLLSTKGLRADWDIQDTYATLGNLYAEGMISKSTNEAICAVMITRQTTTGLMASTAEAVGTEAWNNAVTAAREDAYKEKVLTSWGATDLAILQGSLS